MICGAAIKRGGLVAFVDVENALDPLWAAKFGLDYDSDDRRFFLIQPDCAEDALNAVANMVEMKHPVERNRSAFDIIVVDSVAALTTRNQLKGEIGDKTVAARAQVLAQFFDRTKAVLHDSTTALLLLNQERALFDQSWGYGPKVHMPGGFAPRFYSSIIARTKSQVPPLINKETGEIIARTFHLRTTKNKVSQPEREAEVRVFVDYMSGIDINLELAQVGKDLGVFTDAEGNRITGNKKWYWNGTPIGVGEAKVVEALDDSPEMATLVERDVRAAIAQVNGGGTVPPLDEDTEALTLGAQQVAMELFAHLDEEAA